MSRRVEINLNKRVYSRKPPMFVRPSFGSLPEGFGSLEELLGKLCLASPTFPFERELCRYLLFIYSLWPDDKRRLLDGARIFSASLNYHAAHPTLRVSANELRKFNAHVFDRIGGQKSMLFCQSSVNYHWDVWGRIGDLMMLHDVIEYIIKFCVIWPEMASSKVAFAAVAHNIFKRAGGYGIPKGEKRRAMLPGMVTSPNTVRERWKNGPETVLLSFVFVCWTSIHLFDPGSVSFLSNIRKSVEIFPGTAISKLLFVAGEMLKMQSGSQNHTLTKWAKKITGSPVSGKIFTFRPTDDELERAFVLHDKLFKKPLTEEDKERVRAAIIGRALYLSSNKAYRGVGWLSE